MSDLAALKAAIKRLRTKKRYSIAFWRAVDRSVIRRARLLQESERRLTPLPERMLARFGLSRPVAEKEG